MRSLVVDDSPTIRLVVQHILGPYGPCDVAQNGQEAVDAHLRGLREGHPYHLICLDLGLPYLDGSAVPATIRATEAEHSAVRSRIVLVTASKDLARIQTAYEHGADGCLFKPVVPDELLQYLTDFGLHTGQAGVLDDALLIERISQMCDADEMPVPVLSKLLRRISHSLERQTAEPE